MCLIGKTALPKLFFSCAPYNTHTAYGKTFEGENFHSWNRKLTFTGKLHGTAAVSIYKNAYGYSYLWVKKPHKLPSFPLEYLSICGTCTCLILATCNWLVTLLAYANILCRCTGVNYVVQWFNDLVIATLLFTYIAT